MKIYEKSKFLNCLLTIYEQEKMQYKNLSLCK